ncbi:hypothetical protein BpHYR1_022863 [Brachionus plicatilis]|uniref:Uncharacterized protein n=1 Tax=Brachionus plicatilis TaxID=10195 RepID=A0A3M7RA71_BRAPC|nr:hypothetical protein BpHYR1_022863 [Brachionus plicatilis]
MMDGWIFDTEIKTTEIQFSAKLNWTINFTHEHLFTVQIGRGTKLIFIFFQFAKYISKGHQYPQLGILKCIFPAHYTLYVPVYFVYTTGILSLFLVPFLCSKALATKHVTKTILHNI